MLIPIEIQVDVYSEPGSWGSIFTRATFGSALGERILVVDLVLEDPGNGWDMQDINGFTIVRWEIPEPSQAEIVDYIDGILTNTGGYYHHIIIYTPEKWSVAIDFLLRP